jgi:hypothetical protein
MAPHHPIYHPLYHPLHRRENASTQDPSLTSGTHATVPPLVIAAFVTLSLSLVLLGVFAAIKMRRAWLASKRESSASSVPVISSPRPPAYEEEVSEKFSKVDLTT